MHRSQSAIAPSAGTGLLPAGVTEKPELQAEGGLELLANSLRIGSDLALKLFQLWRRDLDCIDALILFVVKVASLEGIHSDPRLRQRYGAAHERAPDHLRLSINASVVAVSLGLEAEYVRRRLDDLTRRGECQATAAGMHTIVGDAAAAAAESLAEASYRNLGHAYAELDRVGFFHYAPIVEAPAAAGAPPVRSASLLTGKYFLRLLDLLNPPLGDVVEVMIFLELLQHYVQGRPDAVAVAADELAERLGLTADQASRRLRSLAALELCTPRGAGVALSPTAFAEPWMVDALRRNLGTLAQLFAGLAEVGALPDLRAQAAATQDARGRA